MTVKELHERMDSAEISEWMAYDRIEPLPDSWQQTGQICMLLAALCGEKTKITDWIPKPRKVEKMTPEAVSKYLSLLFGKPTEE